MRDKFFDGCLCYPIWHESTQIEEEVTSYYKLETRVNLRWNAASDRLNCPAEFQDNEFHEQLVVNLYSQYYRYHYVTAVNGQITNSAGEIVHQGYTLDYPAHDYSTATDEELANVICILEYDYEKGFWHGEATIPGGGIIGANWIFEYNPTMSGGIRWYYGSLGDPETEIYALSRFNNETSNNVAVGYWNLGRIELDEDCNVIGQFAGVQLPEFMRNRPKTYTLNVPSPILFNGFHNDIEYENEVVVTPGNYTFTNTCIQSVFCEGHPNNESHIYMDCLCEPYKFAANIYWLLDNPCNDPTALALSHGALEMNDSFEILSLYIAAPQAWNQGYICDFRVKAGTSLDHYGETTITPKYGSGESSSSLTIPECTVTFDSFGFD